MKEAFFYHRKMNISISLKQVMSLRPTRRTDRGPTTKVGVKMQEQLSSSPHQLRNSSVAGLHPQGAPQLQTQAPTSKPKGAALHTHLESPSKLTTFDTNQDTSRKLRTALTACRGWSIKSLR